MSFQEWAQLVSEAASAAAVEFDRLGESAAALTETLLDFDWRVAWYVSPADAWWEQ